MKKNDNFETIITHLFGVNHSNPVELTIPYKDGKRNLEYKFMLQPYDVKEVMSLIKRAINRQRLEDGDELVFHAPYDHPEPEREANRRLLRYLSELIIEVEKSESLNERIANLKQIREAIKDLKPDVKMGRNTLDKIVSAFRKYVPELSEEEILAEIK